MMTITSSGSEVEPSVSRPRFGHGCGFDRAECCRSMLSLPRLASVAARPGFESAGAARLLVRDFDQGPSIVVLPSPPDYDQYLLPEIRLVALSPCVATFSVASAEATGLVNTSSALQREASLIDAGLHCRVQADGPANRIRRNRRIRRRWTGRRRERRRPRRHRGGTGRSRRQPRA